MGVAETRLPRLHGVTSSPAAWRLQGPLRPVPPSPTRNPARASTAGRDRGSFPREPQVDRSSRGSSLFPLLTLNFSLSASQAGLGLEDVSRLFRVGIPTGSSASWGAGSGRYLDQMGTWRGTHEGEWVCAGAD